MPEMQINHNKNQATILLEKDLVASMVPELKEALKNLLQQGVTQMEIDLTRVKVVDSTGIGCLIAAHNSLSKLGGGLTVLGVSEDIYELFNSMRLNRHFTIKPVE